MTLFDVYECASSPELLQQRIEQAEGLLSASTLSRRQRRMRKTYPRRSSTSISFRMKPKPRISTGAPADPQLERHLKKHVIEYRSRRIPAPENPTPIKRDQLEAVKRWFHNDWRRIEPKLRTSIVEGISVFLSLFDDNPKVKRIFCPPKECYDHKPARTANTAGLCLLLLADRNRQGLCPQFPYRNKPRFGKSNRGDDEARFRAGGPKPRSSIEATRNSISARFFHLRRVPPFRNGGGERADRR